MSVCPESLSCCQSGLHEIQTEMHPCTVLLLAPPIHLFFLLPRVRPRWQQAKQDVPLHSITFQLRVGVPEVLSGQMRYMIPLASSGFPPRQKKIGEKSKGSCPRRILVNCINHPSWLLVMRRSSSLTVSSIRMSELLTLPLRLSPHSMETHFSILYPRALSFDHDPKLLLTDWGIRFAFQRSSHI